MRIRKLFRTLQILMLAAVLVMSSFATSYAATKAKSVSYKGSGKVTISFEDKVSYDDDVKVKVKDADDKSYSASIKSKSSTSMQIQIKSFKTGEKYKITVSGLSVGTVTGTLKTYSKKSATSTAKETAKDKWKVKKFSDVTAKSTTYKKTSVWKVTFTSGDFKYTYMVSQQKNKVIYSERKKVDA